MFIPLMLQELIILFFTVFVSRNEINKRFITFFLFSFVFLYGIFRDFSLSPDYLGYVDYFMNYENAIVEPSYKLISYIIKDKLKFDIEFLFYFYFICSFMIKVFVICKTSENINFSLLTYCSFILLLQDFIQIRAGLASSFMLLSYYYLMKRQRKMYFLSCLCATLSHFSGLISFLLIFFYKQKSKKSDIFKWVVLTFVSFLMVFLHISVLKLLLLIPIPYIHTKIQTYSVFAKMESTGINPFNIQNLLRTILIFFIYYKKEKVLIHTEDIFLYKMFVLTVFTFCFFWDLGVLGVRISQLFKVFDILFLPLLLRISSKKIYGIMLGFLLLIIQFLPMFTNGYIPIR